MTPQEFEAQYQASISKILNELQSMAIISNRLETTLVEVGTSVQRLNQMVEEYMGGQAYMGQQAKGTTRQPDETLG